MFCFLGHAGMVNAVNRDFRMQTSEKSKEKGQTDGRRVQGKRSIEEMTRLFQFSCRSIRESSARVAHIYIPDRELSADRAEWSPCS